MQSETLAGDPSSPVLDYVAPTLDEPARDPTAAPARTTAEAKVAEKPATEGWGAVHRVAFRFWFAFVVAWLFPYPLGVIPGTGWFGDLVSKGWDYAVVASAAHLLHLAEPVQTAANGSGDRTYDWIALGIQLAIAAVATVVWSALDRRRAYPRLHEGLRIAIRYEVGAAMLGYGLAKIFVGQFPPIPAARLLETYGDSSPMALLWNFMGYSRGYCIFTGSAEVVGGLLLFWRRTTTLGAMVLAGVLANVAALNFFYDVPVKIYSTFLLVQVLWLLAQNGRALFGALVGGTAAHVSELALDFGTKFKNRARLVIKAAFLLLLGFGTAKEFFASGPVMEKSAFDGFYDVASFKIAGASDPLPDDKRWRHVYVGAFSQFYVQTADGHLERMSVKGDKDKPEIELRRRADGKTTKLVSSTPDPTHWSISGPLFDETIEVSLVKGEAPRSFLMERGFHWVNDFPLNR